MSTIKSQWLEGIKTNTETPSTDTTTPNITTHESFYPMDLFTA
jgi:hypothetical protein